MKIKVMADFCSTGLWNEDNGGIMIDVEEELELPLDFTREIDAWIRFYDDVCHEHDKYRFIANKKQVKELNDRGRKIAQKIKVFYPKIEVVYWGENKKGVMKEEKITGV